MKVINMHDAKTQLSRLVEALDTGRELEFIIARNGKPAAKLVAYHRTPLVEKRIGLGLAMFGPIKGLDPEEWAESDAEVAAMFDEGDA